MSATPEFFLWLKLLFVLFFNPEKYFFKKGKILIVQNLLKWSALTEINWLKGKDLRMALQT